MNGWKRGAGNIQINGDVFMSPDIAEQDVGLINLDRAHQRWIGGSMNRLFIVHTLCRELS